MYRDLPWKNLAAKKIGKLLTSIMYMSIYSFYSLQYRKSSLTFGIDTVLMAFV